MATQPLRSIRLVGKNASSLDSMSGDVGEVFYDATTRTLRVYTSRTAGGVKLATEQFVTDAIDDIDLSIYATQTFVTTSINNIPTVDLTSYATQTFVTTSINNIPTVDLTSYASKNYVDNAVSGISVPSLSGLATETFVNNAISSLVASAPSALNTLNELAAALGNDANYATTITTALSNKAPSASPSFTGTATFRNTTDVVTTVTYSSVIDCSASLSSVFYTASPSNSFTVNFTNVSATDNRATAFTIIVDQGSTPYIPNAVQIGGAAQTINWQGGNPPSGDANKKNLFSFVLLRIQGAWTVFGSPTTYG